MSSESGWRDTKTTPPKGMIVVALSERYVCFAQCYGVAEWYECERDGSMVFGRDGSPAYVSPIYWAELPEEGASSCAR